MRHRFLLPLALSILVGCKRGELGNGNAQEADQSQPSSQKQGEDRPGLVTIGPEAQEKTGMKMLTVHRQSVPVRFVASGQIGLDEEKTVHTGTYVDGRVTELKAKIGDVVHRGDVMARLHSHSVHETRAALESAIQEVGRQQQTVDFRRRMSERVQRLFALKSASQQEVERANTDLESAETDLRNARISVQKETVHLADLLRMPESQVTHVDEMTEQAPILAPIDGQVVDRKITLGSVVEPGQELFTVSDLSTVWMTASVNEADISKVRIGSRVSARTAAYPDQAFQGRVTYIAAELDTQTRTLPVRILLPNTQRKLHPGMFAEAELVQGASRKSFFIPEEAIQDLNGGSVVFACKGNARFEPQPIEIASRLNGFAEIRAGLNEGDTIVTRGSFIVKSELLKSKVGE